MTFMGLNDISVTECALQAIYKVVLLIRTGLDLCRKIPIKIVSVLMQKLGFRLYETEFLTKQATPPPLRGRSDLTRSFASILSSLLETVSSSLAI